MTPLATSAELLQQVRDPANREAWQRFVTLYVPVIRCWARRATGHSADADDLVQDFFLELYKSLPEFEYQSSGHLLGWLKTRFRFVRLNWQRHRRVEVRPPELLPDRAVPPEQEQAEALEDLQVLVRQAEKTIRGDFTRRVWKAYEEQMKGHKAAAVAARLGMTRAAVYVAKSRVLARLRQELAGLVDPPHP
jgi:RNA polymerase sigma-70 factor (ECF subfamily)